MSKCAEEIGHKLRLCDLRQQWSLWPRLDRGHIQGPGSEVGHSLPDYSEPACWQQKVMGCGSFDLPAALYHITSSCWMIPMTELYKSNILECCLFMSKHINLLQIIMFCATFYGSKDPERPVTASTEKSVLSWFIEPWKAILVTLWSHKHTM